MYIQNQPPPEMPFSLPKGYSGNAFAPQPQAEPAQEAPEETETVEPPGTLSEPEQAPAAQAESTEAFAPARGEKHTDGGIFSRLPFLSSLLPPSRKKRGGREGLPEWAVIAVVLFLLLDSNENDLLPFLLLLLLWD